MDPIQVATLLGAVVTKVVDLARNSFDPNQQAPKWVWNIAAFALGILLATVAQLNLIDKTGVHGALGIALTGVLLGGSGSALHELLDLLSSSAKKANPPGPSSGGV